MLVSISAYHPHSLMYALKYMSFIQSHSISSDWSKINNQISPQNPLFFTKRNIKNDLKMDSKKQMEVMVEAEEICLKQYPQIKVEHTSITKTGILC